MDVFRWSSIYLPSCFFPNTTAAVFGLLLKRTEMGQRVGQRPGWVAEQLRSHGTVWVGHTQSVTGEAMA